MTTDEARTQLDPLGTPRTVRMVRRFSAPPSRLYRCWTDPEEIVRWFPERVEGSLALATRSILVFPDQRVSWGAERAGCRQPPASDKGAPCSLVRSHLVPESRSSGPGPVSASDVRAPSDRLAAGFVTGG